MYWKKRMKQGLHVESLIYHTKQIFHSALLFIICLALHNYTTFFFKYALSQVKERAAEHCAVTLR